ncbi:MAG: type secretion outer membrane protein TolC family, partial [Methylobacterium brachiatum]|nr:type secretion outer membrane protein TolC family [Methylobacterium brachiatum]
MTIRPPASCPALRIIGIASGLAIFATNPSIAETLESALAKAYQGNPSLNAGRAGVRAVDENVAIAQSGYRPQVNVGASIGVQYLQTRSGSSVSAAAGATSTGASTASTGTTGGGTAGSAGASGLGGAAAGATTGIGTGTAAGGLGSTGTSAGGLASNTAGQAAGGATTTNDVTSQVVT